MIAQAPLDSRRGLAQFPPALAGDVGSLWGFGAEGATAPETLRQKDRAS
jgi:hypothetical protein